MPNARTNAPKPSAAPATPPTGLRVALAVAEDDLLLKEAVNVFRAPPERTMRQ